MFLFLNSYYRNDRVRKRDFFIPMGKGTIIYIVSLLISWLFTLKVAVGEVTVFSLFRYQFLYYNGFVSLLWMFLFLVSRWVNIRRNGSSDTDETREIMLYLLPLFLGDSLYRMIIQESWYGLVELCFIPLGNMGLMTLAAIFINRMIHETSIMRFLYPVLLVFSVFATSVIPLLGVYNLIFISGLWSFLFLGLSLFLFFRTRTAIGGK